MFDIIGDIHGFATELKKLLQKLDYQQVNGIYQHPQRKVIFLGDFVDRGDEIAETLAIVRNMIDNGFAYSVMGNHEYNAICFHTQNANGDFLRPHTEKNVKLYQKTLDAFADTPQLLDDYIEWFKTLPLFLEIEGIRVVHACWDSEFISFLKEHLDNNRLNDNFLLKSAQKGTCTYHVVENTLKGKEVELPQGYFFHDKEAINRHKIRIKWWDRTEPHTYKNVSIMPAEYLPNIEISEEDKLLLKTYTESEPPVFIGHYWFSGTPTVLQKNICCLDYSVARGGKLVAYRWDGEQELDNRKFVFHLTIG
jgi:hypothetical protein